MTQQLSPWVEGAYGWNFGEGGWNTGMDSNLLKFSFLFDRNVDSIVASLPPAVNGQAHYLTTDNRLYFAVGTTYYSTSVPKWFTIILRDTGATWQFNGSTLEEIDSLLTIDSRLDSVELAISSLGSASLEDVGFFASQSALDVAVADSANYTDTLAGDLLSTSSGSVGAGKVGFSNGLVYPTMTVGSRLKELAPGIPGADPTGILDSTAAIQAWVDANSVIVFDPSATYLLSNQITISQPKIIDQNGSTLNFQLTTQVPGYNVQSNFVRICRGVINVTGTVMGGPGQSLNCVFAGNQGTGAGFHTLHFHDLTVSTNRNDAGASIGIIGECHNVLIENIKVPDNANCRNIIGIEWGGTPVGGTGHPHNITVRNIDIGRLTFPTYGSAGYAYAVWISAAFNVRVENVSMVEGYGLVMAIRGDNANTYAPASYKHLVGRGITVDNASIGECFGYGIRAIGSHRSMTLDNIPMSVAFRNIKVGGKKVGANNNFAASFEQSDGVILDDFEFNGTLTAGFATGTNNDNLYIGHGSVNGCELYGGALGSSCRWPTVERVKFFGNNTLAGGGTGTAALVLVDTLHPNIKDNIFSEPGATETQKYSISMTSATVSPKLNNNHTYALAAAGVAYANSTASNVSGTGNTAESGITVNSGTPIAQIRPNGTRVFYGDAIPVSGAYIVGDIMMYNVPAAGAILAKCTVAGSPGTWVNV